MIDIVTIKGFAIPFETVVTVEDGRQELIERGAFREQLRLELPVSLIFGSHDPGAPELGHNDTSTLELYECSYGLAFSATLMPDLPNASDIVREIHSGGFNLCSVNFVDRQFETIDGVERVTAAVIDHIALYSDYTSYGGYTAAWIANRPVAALDHRRQLMIDRWDAGFKEHRAIRRGPENPARAKLISEESDFCPIEAEAAERKLTAMLRDYQRGGPHTDRAPIPSTTKGSGLKLISELFTKAFAARDAHAVQLAALEARVARLEGKDDD